jgi:hypothetical protein
MTAYYNVKHLIKIKYESSEKLQNAGLDRKQNKIHINHNYWNTSKEIAYTVTCLRAYFSFNDLALDRSSTTGWSSKGKTSSLSREKKLFNLFSP